MRYGKIFDDRSEFNNSGVWETLHDGKPDWRPESGQKMQMSLKSCIQKFSYGRKELLFFVYNPNKNFRSFTELNNTEDRQFATTPVP